MILIALIHSIKESVLHYRTRKQLSACSTDTLDDVGISNTVRAQEASKATSVNFLRDVYRKTLREMRD